MAEQAQVLRDLGSGWQECLDSQGVFYFNSLTGQSQDTLPPGVGGVPVVHQHTPVAAHVQLAAPCAAASYANAYQLQGLQAQQVQEATVKMKVGVWSVCEDQQGEFYHNGVTGQTFDNPPPELVGLLQQSQGHSPAAAVYQTQAAPVYQALVAQGAPVYHTSTIKPGSPVYHSPASAAGTLVQGVPAVSTSFKSPVISSSTSAYQSSVGQRSAAPATATWPQYVSHGFSQGGYQHQAQPAQVAPVYHAHDLASVFQLPSA
jgi:hypothetical protein